MGLRGRRPVLIIMAARPGGSPGAGVIRGGGFLVTEGALVVKSRWRVIGIQ